MVHPAPRALLLAGLVLAAAACSDRNPTGLRVSPPEVVPPPPTHAALQCRMDVRAESLTCAPATPETAPGVSPLIVGGQGTNVRLTSSGTSWNAATSILRSSVTVQNLMSQALGTIDGVFPSPEGVRVFFQTGPTVTEGTGTVTVANADGQAVFTAGEQPYFQYEGMLSQGGTTAPREWRFNVPATATRFVFTVLVSAPVQGPGVPPPGMVILADGVTDTVDATPSARLRVGVRGADGKPAANVMLQAYGIGLPYPWYGQEVLVGVVGGSGFSYSEYAWTNAQGVAEFRVKLGTRAGTGRVLVMTLGSPGVQDTARYTILPGRATSVRSLPEDTTVSIGGRVPLQLTVSDRYGNARSDMAALSVVSGPGSTVGNEVVGGSSIGRVMAVATAAGVSDTSYVTVVPAGTVAAYTGGSGSALYTFNLDGTNVRQVRVSAIGGGYNGSMPVGWLTSTKLVYHDNKSDHTKQLYVHDLVTGKASRFLPLRDWMEMENYPRVSRDGSWVYFSGGKYDIWSVYRARPDGTGKEQLLFSPGGSNYEWGADLSPDGERIVFVRDGNYYPGDLVIGELATRTARRLDLDGLFPRWSPDGTRIAFVATSDPYYYASGPVAVVNADGSDARALTTTAYKDVEWSPDGKYIIGAIIEPYAVNKLGIIEVATGEEVIVSYPKINGYGNLLAPVWKP